MSQIREVKIVSMWYLNVQNSGQKLAFMHVGFKRAQKLTWGWAQRDVTWAFPVDQILEEVINLKTVSDKCLLDPEVLDKPQMGFAKGPELSNHIPWQLL